ncbi:hypothetical protein [Arthrobacter sp. H14]|uniref:hypothetical protein n=1 Tax=Arthrobacter sp. H14 TaxID=1312959 RepID=UPI00047AE7E0|nr:hypothetical protein [Arthrobacter sp. H14]
MRTLAKLTAGVVVLLALAGCSNDPKSAMSALEAPPGTADTFGGDADALGIAADSVRLLGEENGYAFYIAAPDNPENGNVCLVIETLEADTASAGCHNIPSVTPLELAVSGVRAKLVVDDYDAGKELSEGWRQLHQNLLVRL